MASLPDRGLAVKVRLGISIVPLKQENALVVK